MAGDGIRQKRCFLGWNGKRIAGKCVAKSGKVLFPLFQKIIFSAGRTEKWSREIFLRAPGEIFPRNISPGDEKYASRLAFFSPWKTCSLRSPTPWCSPFLPGGIQKVQCLLEKNQFHFCGKSAIITRKSPTFSNFSLGDTLKQPYLIDDHTKKMTECGIRQKRRFPAWSEKRIA